MYWFSFSVVLFALSKQHIFLYIFYIHQINIKWSASPFFTRKNRFNENKKNNHVYIIITTHWRAEGSFRSFYPWNIEKQQNHGLLKVNIKRKRKKSRSENFVLRNNYSQESVDKVRDNSFEDNFDSTQSKQNSISLENFSKLTDKNLNEESIFFITK